MAILIQILFIYLFLCQLHLEDIEIFDNNILAHLNVNSALFLYMINLQKERGQILGCNNV